MFIQHPFCFFVLLGLNDTLGFGRRHFTLLSGRIGLLGRAILRIIPRFGGLLGPDLSGRFFVGLIGRRG